MKYGAGVVGMSLMGTAGASNPMGMVISLIDELTAKVVRDGEAEEKAYVKFYEWCDETNKNTKYEISTAESTNEKLTARLNQLASDISAATDKIDELAGAIAKDDSELKDAIVIRKKEKEDFLASEAELEKALSALSRAIDIVGKDMAKNPSALAQVNAVDVSSAMRGLSVVLDAAAFNSQDQHTLMAFVQSQQGSDSDDDDLGAPAAATYKTHSGNIMDVLEDMKEKAEGQLSELRKEEANTQHNFEMLKQSLEDQMAADTKDMNDEKAARAASKEESAKTQGDLDVNSKGLANSKQDLATARSSCIQVGADHETTVTGRKEELSVLAQAKKILEETSSGAVSQTYAFLQITTPDDLATTEVAVAVKQLAKQQHSAALAQLASRINAVMRFGASSGANPFGKVKGLIVDMIAKLEKEGNEEALEKAFCDEQMSKTEAKKSELEGDIARQTSRIDRAAAKSAETKTQIRRLESELATLAKEQANLDKIRREGNSDYTQAKTDLELGLSGVRNALKVLRDYYGGSSSMLQDDAKFGALIQQPAKPVLHSQSGGAGQGIIDILEVCESDFAKNLAQTEQEEADAQSLYEKITQENAVTKTTKDQDVKYKTQEAKSLDTTAAEYTADRETANKELSAVLDYYAKIKDRCVAVPETYADRKARRAAEIEGLKQALSILEDETALVQRKKRGSFRGTLSA